MQHGQGGQLGKVSSAAVAPAVPIAQCDHQYDERSQRVPVELVVQLKPSKQCVLEQQRSSAAGHQHSLARHLDAYLAGECAPSLSAPALHTVHTVLLHNTALALL